MSLVVVVVGDIGVQKNEVWCWHLLVHPVVLVVVVHIDFLGVWNKGLCIGIDSNLLERHVHLWCFRGDREWWGVSNLWLFWKIQSCFLLNFFNKFKHLLVIHIIIVEFCQEVNACVLHVCLVQVVRRFLEVGREEELAGVWTLLQLVLVCRNIL